MKIRIPVNLENGQSVPEYALIIVVVAAVVALILILLGPNIGDVFSDIKTIFSP